jgi:hypothetical protein
MISIDRLQALRTRLQAMAKAINEQRRRRKGQPEPKMPQRGRQKPRARPQMNSGFNFRHPRDNMENL